MAHCMKKVKGEHTPYTNHWSMQ